MRDLDAKRKELAAFNAELEGVDEDIAQLRNAYEQYFLGLERKPPSKQHDALKKRVQKLKTLFIRQTAMKFRLNSIEQKFQSYERMWLRSLQEIENGTYRRDLTRLKRKVGPAPQASSATAAPAGAAAQPGAPRAQAAAGAAAGPRPPTGAPLTDDKLKAVFDAYLMAKRRCQEDTSKLSYDTVASTLRKQVPELLKKHNAKEIDFKVVIKDGKAVLRAVPK